MGSVTRATGQQVIDRLRSSLNRYEWREALRHWDKAPPSKPEETATILGESTAAKARIDRRRAALGLPPADFEFKDPPPQPRKPGEKPSGPLPEIARLRELLAEAVGGADGWQERVAAELEGRA